LAAAALAMLLASNTRFEVGKFTRRPFAILVGMHFA
jgi:hypothetical protein